MLAPSVLSVPFHSRYLYFSLKSFAPPYAHFPMPAVPSSTGLTITDPIVAYRTLLALKQIRPDPAQHRLALQLQKLYYRLKDYNPELEYRHRLDEIARSIPQTSKLTSQNGSKQASQYWPLGIPMVAQISRRIHSCAHSYNTDPRIRRRDPIAPRDAPLRRSRSWQVYAP
jgi:hypothetical protein